MAHASHLHIDIAQHHTPAQLVQVMMPLVKRIAARMSRGLPSHVRTDDLISAGTVGLMEATRRFESKRADSFVGYATLRIRGAMLDELRRGDILSQEARTKSRQVQAAQQKMQSALHREPTPAEVAAELGVSEQEYVEELEGLQHIKVVAFDPQEDAFGIVDTTHPSPIDASVFAQLKGRLSAAISTLPEKEQLILSLYYEEDLTYKEIGDMLDLTAARICQLHAQAVSRLKTSLEQHEQRKLAA
jgi:RNA polymerase sigma factor for flagellar operon FliA